MTAKEKRQRKQIIDLLKEKNLYEVSDEILIEELLFLQGIIAKAKESIETHGLLVNVRAGMPDLPPLFQLNQATGLYRDSLKSLITICTNALNLGIVHFVCCVVTIHTTKIGDWWGREHGFSSTFHRHFAPAIAADATDSELQKITSGSQTHFS